MYELDGPTGVHVGSICWWVQAKALAASQQDVQIVMEVMVQPTTSSCSAVVGLNVKCLLLTKIYKPKFGHSNINITYFAKGF